MVVNCEYKGIPTQELWCNSSYFIKNDSSLHIGDVGTIVYEVTAVIIIAKITG